jgi:primosomal protein N' (replication factor Y)
MSKDQTIDSKTFEASLQRILNHDVDLIIGTQMLAKGHHFPKLTLVVVVDGDLGLQGTDFRAGERVYQILHQISGRAGREAQQGNVLIQTHTPEHPIFQALKDRNREAYYAYEKEERQKHHLPPYSQWISITVKSTSEQNGIKTLLHLNRMLPYSSTLNLLGPIPAPLFQRQGHFRWRFLIQSQKKQDAMDFVHNWSLSWGDIPSNTRIYVDTSPYDWS